MIEHITSLFEAVAYAADLFGLSLLTLGFARGALGWVRAELDRQPWEQRLVSIRRLRCVVAYRLQPLEAKGGLLGPSEVIIKM